MIEFEGEAEREMRHRGRRAKTLGNVAEATLRTFWPENEGGAFRSRSIAKFNREGALDHMGSTELAANLFRATQAEEKLRRDMVKGKVAANRTHREVGAKVRKTIQELGGTMPEELPAVESIKKIMTKQRKRLRKTEPPEKKKLE